MNIAHTKRSIRKQIDALRQQLSESDRAEYSRIICERTLHYITTRGTFSQECPFTLLGYVPFRAEVDVTPILEWCWSQGHRVVLPKVHAADKTMDLYVVEHWDQLETGAYGIREPLPSLVQLHDYSSISIMLVPGLAFDSSMNRLGYGGGYYDRFVQALTDSGLPLPLMLLPAFDLQMVQHIPVESHDLCVDAVITEVTTYPQLFDYK